MGIVGLGEREGAVHGRGGLSDGEAAAVTADRNPVGSFPNRVLWDVTRHCIKKKKKKRAETCSRSQIGSHPQGSPGLCRRDRGSGCDPQLGRG